MRRRHRRSRAAVEDSQVFRSGKDVAGAVAVVGIRIVSRHKNKIARPVDCARGRLAGHLGDPIAVEVIDHKLRVVRPGADIAAQVDPP